MRSVSRGHRHIPGIRGFTKVLAERQLLYVVRLEDPRTDQEIEELNTFLLEKTAISFAETYALTQNARRLNNRTWIIAGVDKNVRLAVRERRSK